MNSRTGDLSWFILLLSGLLLSLGGSWHIWAKLDYGYSWWYDVLQIEQHIDYYGPQNRYKLGLEQLDRAQHESLFSDIVQAVHQHGEGLREISYTVIYSDDNHKSIALLREPEAVHLQDVANLIDALNLALLWLLPVSALLLFVIQRYDWHLKWSRQLLVLAALVIMTTALVLGIGPKAVFYQMHVWIFPAENEWFFYYQDSLMTTLMHAPQLFGLIAVGITALGLVLFAAWLAGLRYWLKTRERS
ncbi:DUF1461 domain-containing protein [Bacterioplanes sanyensis]|uniref:DUF1461 domain-containing protein n=1 Tax=Bacterioplanes sanyensis TaxID=1249553 RepID=A0A222FMJ8_9GAMM|nr:DUF1461 domain-containing protein [Bacterioplanes sanyensis]ASP39744.1 DUF1461 domain-containing protein [Bacterioplanes sanyensis]